jgi:hypothetical protein
LAQSAQPPGQPVQPLLPPFTRNRGAPLPPASVAFQRRPGLTHCGINAPSSTPHPPAVPPPLFILRIEHHLKSSCFIPINQRPFLRLNHRPPPSTSALYKGRAPALLHRTSPHSPSPLPALHLSPYIEANFFQKCKLMHFSLGEDFMMQKVGVTHHGRRHSSRTPPNGGLRLQPSSGHGSGSLHQSCGGLDRGHCGVDRMYRPVAEIHAIATV